MNNNEMDSKNNGMAKTLKIGGFSKESLIEKLKQNSVRLNEYAETMIADERFILSKATIQITITEITVDELGFPEGTTLPELFQKAEKLGLRPCPIETGLFLRLQFLNQKEMIQTNPVKYQAPSGSITIASKKISEEDAFPRGFYIRKMDGEYWLRGYVADDVHKWNPDDRFVFCKEHWE